MNHPNIRRNVFVTSTIVLALALVVSLWRHASAKQIEADGQTAEKLTRLCEGVATVDSTKLEQILKLAVALDSNDPQHKGWLSLNNVRSLSNHITSLGDQLHYVSNQLDRLSTNAISEKTAALPGLTEACLAAVNSAQRASNTVMRPVAELRQQLIDLNDQLSKAENRLKAYRRDIIAASRTPHEAAINDLPMQEMFGCNIAAIGSASEVILQSERNDFYRKVLTETPNVEWVTATGLTLVPAPELLGMDIVVRTFREGEETCGTKLIRFFHGEDIRLAEGTERVIILFCKPEQMTKSGTSYAQNGVRFCAKQMITLNRSH